MRVIGVAAILSAAGFAFIPGAKADILTLSSGNSQMQVDANTPAGIFSWTVDGTDLLQKQWFWIRTGADASEHPLAAAPYALTASDFSGSSGTLEYTGNGLSVQIALALTGGPAGSRNSDLIEAIKVKNTTALPIDVAFFQYVDLNLSASDAVQFINPTSVQQVGSPTGGWVFRNETVVSSDGLTHHEAATGSYTLDNLNDGGLTNLNDADFAEGDATWAFQWEKRLAGGSSFVISEDHLNIGNSVPESPLTTAAVLLAGLAACLMLRRNREYSRAGKTSV